MKVPPSGLIVGVATVAGAVTLRVSALVFVTPAPVAVIVIGKLPVGVEVVVPMLKTVEQVGLHEGSENDEIAPEGIPEALKDTVSVLPATKPVVIVVVPEEPAATARLPAFDMVKSKVGRTEALENQTATSALGCRLLLNAFAFTNALEVRVIGRVYFRDDSIAGCPSVV